MGVLLGVLTAPHPQPCWEPSNLLLLLQGIPRGLGPRIIQTRGRSLPLMLVFHILVRALDGRLVVLDLKWLWNILLENSKKKKIRRMSLSPRRIQDGDRACEVEILRKLTVIESRRNNGSIQMGKYKATKGRIWNESWWQNCFKRSKQEC